MSINDFDRYEEFESWEDDYDLLISQQYDKLVVLREQVTKKYPDDLQAVLDLCEAYCLNLEYQKSLDKLSMIYVEYADTPFVQYQILDSLKGLDRSYDDFNWIEQPIIFRLDEKTYVTIFEILKNKRHGMSVIDLELELIILGYKDFKTDELVEFLSKDSRFQVIVDGHFMSAVVKKRGKHNRLS